MHIRQLALAAALAAASSWATAEDIVTPVDLTPDNGSFSAMIEVTHTMSGLFVDQFTFELPTTGTVMAEFFSDDPGLALTVGLFAGEEIEFMDGVGSITVGGRSGMQSIDILGSAGDPFGETVPLTASYSGNITFTPAMVGVIPEPQTYALMLAGLGLVGFMARRRRRA